MPSAPDRESTFESLSLTVFSVFGAISLAIWWSPLTSSLALALHDEQYTHILLILPISAALIFMDWKPPEPHSGLSVVLGTVLLAAAASLAFFMRWRAVALSPDERLSASMLALVAWWIAAFILCFGLHASRRALFPLCFLFWMVPFPEFVLNPVVNLLQQGSAAAAHLLFAAAGVPVEQHGVFVHIPGLTVEVARECSSIRSSSMLIVTTMVLAQLLLRSPWRKALIILLSIPLSVAKNGLRIFTIAMLTTRVDPSFLTGRLHREGGIIFFLIALAATFVLLWILRRGEDANHSLRATRAVSTEI
ncbi:MAG: exosortase/archaeosortase family protein [Candidatus Sulfotelmatobacter sp.]